MAQEATIKVTAEDGDDGLRVAWSRDLLKTIAEEAKAKSEDPEKCTPPERALDQFGAGKLHGYLNAASEILHSLEHAKLIDEKADTGQGRPARLLTFALDVPLSQRDKKIIKEVNATAQIWVGANGVPLAAQRARHFKGRAMLVVTFEMAEDEQLEYARVGNRLVVVRHFEERNNSGAGESGQQKTTAVVTLIN